MENRVALADFGGDYGSGISKTHLVHNFLTYNLLYITKKVLAIMQYNRS